MRLMLASTSAAAGALQAMPSMEAGRPPGAEKNGTTNGPLVPAAPEWKCAALGGARLAQWTAKSTVSVPALNRPMARASGSAGVGTSLAPDGIATRVAPDTADTMELKSSTRGVLDSWPRVAPPGN